MLAHGEHLDISDDYHLVVVFSEDGVIQHICGTFILSPYFSSLSLSLTITDFLNLLSAYCLRVLKVPTLTPLLKLSVTHLLRLPTYNLLKLIFFNLTLR